MSLQEDVPDEDCQVEDYEGDTSAKNNQNAMVNLISTEQTHFTYVII